MYGVEGATASTFFRCGCGLAYAILAGMGKTRRTIEQVFASRGGKARAAKLSPERRMEIARAASAAAKAKREALKCTSAK